MSRKTLDDFLNAENEATALDTDVELLQDDNTLRLSREDTTRDAEEEEYYTPPEHLPEIKVETGYVARWVRVSTFGQADASNFAAQNQDGWEPISPSENPELARRCRFHKSNESNKDLIEIGGLVACKMPQKRAEARARYYDDKAKGAFRAEVQRMQGESNSKLPMGVFEKSFKSSRSLDG